MDRQTFGNQTQKGTDKIVGDLFIVVFMFGIMPMVIVAIAGFAQAARKKTEEDKRIAEERRRLEMIRQDPKVYELFREWELSGAATTKEAAERKREILEKVGTTGTQGLLVLLKLLTKNRQ